MLNKFFLFLILMQLYFAQSYSQNIFESLSLDDTAMVETEDISAESPPILEKKWNHFETKFFSLNFGLAVFLDYNIVDQDEASIQQVEKVEPAVEFRAQRIILSGSLLFFKRPWKYMISANYNGMDAPQDKKSFDIIDLNIDIPIGKKIGYLTVGKQKEGVGHEYVLPGSQAMFTERGTGVPAIVKQRNIGIRYSNNLYEQRMSYTLGVFNSWLESGNERSFSDNGMQVTARITGLPVYTDDRNLFHIGVGYKYSDAPGGKFTYKAKPEANTTPSFINTGSFNAVNSNTVMLDLIGVQGPLTAIAEYMQVFVNSTSAENPVFNYWQIGGSWFITGDNRKYNKVTGSLGKLFPKKNFTFSKGGGPGAFEVGLRYTHTDFTDKNIKGGIFGRFSSAVSWYPNAHFRFEINYSYGKLDKNDLIGKSNFWQFRAQFEL